MGASNSREALGQLVTIYGFNEHNFPWRLKNGKTFYRTNGLIFNIGASKYVVTVRSGLVGCGDLVMYYADFKGEGQIMRNELHILFQCIDYDIIILGTINHNELRLDESDNISDGTFDDISGGISNNYVIPSYDIRKNKYIVPSRRANYLTVVMDMDMDSKVINYCADIYDVRYIGDMVVEEKYLPRNYIYKFEIDEMKERVMGFNPDTVTGVCGSFIINGKRQLIGLITQVNKKELTVLPKKTLFKIIKDFEMYRTISDKYNGPPKLPFALKASKGSAKVICLHNQETVLKKNDHLISISDSKIIVCDNEIMVHDEDLKKNIPIDIFFKINCGNNPTKVSFIRGKEEFSGHISSCDSVCQCSNIDIPLSKQPYFHPRETIPYIIVKSFVVVQLTHEFLDIIFRNLIIPKNYLIKKYMNGKLAKIEKILLIIDCLDDEFADRYELPLINGGFIGQEEQIVDFYVLDKINNVKVSTFEDVNKILSENSKITIKMKRYENILKKFSF